MSLNGLDDATVSGAYQGALAEGGGWFLLKYLSRDAVDVLARGTGGAHEARAAVAQYQEKSPLYGFLLYRRRKVLIKYTPEGMSRLLQARVAVHFTAVAEKFTPHDITMSITSADELSDSALTAACSLHTAAPSSCSSSSSRRKLDEITEDAEEGPGNERDAHSLSRPTTSSSSKATITQALPADVPLPLNVPEPSQANDGPPQLENPLQRSKTTEDHNPSLSHDIAKAMQEQPTEPKASEIRNSLKAYDGLFENGPDPRLSSQTARPAISDLYAEIYAQYNKPKVKLGPRPKVSMDAKRPHTSGPGAQNASRPVSSLPANMRIANRKTMEPKRPKSRESSLVPSIAFPAPPPMPAFPVPPSMSAMADLPPPKSPASVRSMTLPGYPNHGQKSNGKSQERQRLMRALELRKKQMKAMQERDDKEAEMAAELVVDDEKTVGRDAESGELLTVGEPDPSNGGDEKGPEPQATDSKVTQQGAETNDTVSALEESPKEPVKNEGSVSVGKEVEQSISESNNAQANHGAETSNPADTITPAPLRASESTELEAGEGLPKKDESASSETKPAPSIVDSGVDVISSMPETDDIHSAASASSPTTAQTQDSSGAPSTRPSSLSEDDNISTSASKVNDCNEAALQRLEMAADASQNEDEEDSVESTPTVVPDNSSPVSSVQSPSPQQSLPVELSTGVPIVDEALTRRNNRESVIFVPSTKPDEALSQRKSKRESVVFSPSNEPLPTEEALSRREKRESMVLTIPERRSQGDNKEKRNTAVDPVRISVHGDNSEEYLSDDSFMEELQSATVQEAKPISVSKSPINPFFPRKASVSESERSVSHQSRPGRLSPDQASSRKVSGAWPPQANMDHVAVPKKINVSSGISQRIKALAEKSNRESSASVSSLATPDASASIVAQRKSSFFSTPPAGDSPSGKLINRLSLASFAKLSNSTTPDRQSVMQSTPTPRDGPTVYNVKQAAEKPESVQVTARIIRDSRPLKPSLTMPSEGTPLDLHRSQITIDHQKSSGKSPVKGNQSKMEPTSPRPPSSSHSKDQGGVPRSSSESSWRSFGRRLSESKSGGAPRSLSAHSSESTEDRREDRKDKKDSRTSKLFKRMSSISSMTRKGHQEDEHASTSLPSVREPPPAVQVGDLNVQFPDTLLWKRRWVEIDAAGNLVLSLSKPNEQSKGLTKRFHLSEFRTPFAPDQDRQELPNSVVFDFIDGRTLQCACETYAAQVQVLQVFREAHDAWIAYSQGL